jgi:hypothetical protein
MVLRHSTIKSLTPSVNEPLVVGICTNVYTTSLEWPPTLLKGRRLEQDFGFQWNMWPVVPVSTVLMVCSIDIVAYEVEDMQVEVANITWRSGQ